MCGIAGLVDPNWVETDWKKFSVLLLMNSTRGMDSTGVFCGSRRNLTSVFRDAPISFMKTDSSPIQFVNSSEYKVLRSYHQKPFFVVGHARAATKGNVESSNAHPFVSKNKNIIGIHNGTMRGKYPFEKDFETDSEALINILAEEGPDGIKDLNGAFALVWYNKEERSLNFFRNVERPLFMRNSPGFYLSFASEKWMLETGDQRYTEVEELPELVHRKLLFDELPQDTFDKHRISWSVVDTRKERRASVYYRSNNFSSAIHDFGDAYGEVYNPVQIWGDTEETGSDTVDKKDGVEEYSRTATNSLPTVRDIARSKYLQKLEEKDFKKNNSGRLLHKNKNQRSLIKISKSLEGFEGIQEDFYEDLHTGKIRVKVLSEEPTISQEEWDKILHSGCAECKLSSDIYSTRIWLNNSTFVCESCNEGTSTDLFNHRTLN